MEHVNERTRLLANENIPHYFFSSSIINERKRRVRQFQCCLCSIFLCTAAIALVVIVSYSISVAEEPSKPTNSSIASVPTINLMASAWPKADKPMLHRIYPNSSLWDEAFVAGQAALDEREKVEESVPTLPKSSPSYKHQKVTSTSNRAWQLSKVGYVEEAAAKYLMPNRLKVEKLCRNETDGISAEFCHKEIFCNAMQKFRTLDGSCNNLKFASQYGVAYKPFRRTLPPDYGDGISKPRTSKSNESLPSARIVSLIVHRPYYRNDPQFSVMLAVWGQFLDHDITATALSKGKNGSSISCCTGNQPMHPECFPVILDPEDPLVQFNETCMEFVRSAPAPLCCLGPREQLNQVTSFIDGSVVYGAEDDKTRELRTLENGQLKMYVTQDNRTLLPQSEDKDDGCNREEANNKGEYCFTSGDARANENLHLTSMHLIWARHHNNLAKNLSKINPHWDDERLFQEARRILGAQMQHITYKEFLPILLGNEVMEKLNLYPQNAGYFTKYNDSIDPSIANSFAAASFRFAHTLIPGLMKLLANDTSSPEYIQMHKMLFDPYKLYQPGEMDRAIRGALNTSIEASDAYFTSELKDHLFENPDKKSRTKCGLDLVSLNIQRGRDHGLPAYPEWRQHCGLSKPKVFEDLESYMDKDPLLNIKAIYKNVSDIDLYTGLLSERPLKGSILGPTITCLILDQFVRLKSGDRFWYENPQRPVAFTPDQLNEIRKTTLAKIICDNSDNVNNAQPLVMQRIRKGNENVPCSDIPRLNLSLWKESNLTAVALMNNYVTQESNVLSTTDKTENFL